MNKTSISKRRLSFIVVIILGMIGIAFVGAAWMGGASPALADVPSATVTHLPSYGLVQIPKPTYTPTPTSMPTPVVAPTNTAEAMISAEIVNGIDTSISTGGQPAPASPAYDGNKYILVDISEQHMYVYEGDTLVFNFIASTGMHNATRVGTFSVLDKIPNAYGATWNIWMPNWLGIYYAGSLENGIHALPILPGGAQLWEGYLGTPISYGCVVLSAYDSQVLYDWAEVGTPVEIQR